MGYIALGIAVLLFWLVLKIAKGIIKLILLIVIVALALGLFSSLHEPPVVAVPATITPDT